MVEYRTKHASVGTQCKSPRCWCGMFGRLCKTRLVFFGASFYRPLLWIHFVPGFINSELRWLISDGSHNLIPELPLWIEISSIHRYLVPDNQRNLVGFVSKVAYKFFCHIFVVAFGHVSVIHIGRYLIPSKSTSKAANKANNTSKPECNFLIFN